MARPRRSPHSQDGEWEACKPISDSNCAMNEPKNQNNREAPVVARTVLYPFILVTSLFALWGFANDVTNPLVKAFKDVFVISNKQSSLVQTAFYGGYATMAIPAALFIRRFTYKAGIIVGLALYATGAMISIPAAAHANFNLFLVALYVLTFGLAFLETTANPFILSMGAPETATRRLNLAQAFNPMGSLTGMAVASGIILANLQISTYRSEVQAYHDGLTEPAVVTAVQDLSRSADGVQTALKDNPSARARELAGRLDAVVGEFENRVNVDPVLLGFLRAEDARRKAEGKKGLREIDYEETLALSLAAFKEGRFESFHGASFEQMQQHDLAIVKKPYVGIGLVVIAVLLVFIFSKMPDTGQERDKSLNLGPTLRRLWHNKRYVEGVFAQTFYVGAQIMCWTFIIHYGTANLGMTAATAQNYNIVAMVIFCTSRFICTFLLKYFSPGKLLMVLAFGGVLTCLGTIFLPGYAGLYSLIGISACMSLMFPTIYGIALEGMGEDAKIASAGLIFAIVGGALMPPLQGWIIDLGGESGKLLGLPAVSASFALPMLCFVFIAIYGRRTMVEHAERRRLAASAA